MHGLSHDSPKVNKGAFIHKDLPSQYPAAHYLVFGSSSNIIWSLIHLAGPVHAGNEAFTVTVPMQASHGQREEAATDLLRE